MRNPRPIMGHVKLLFLLTTVCAAAACGEAKVSEPSASVASEQQSGNIQTLHVDPLAMPPQIDITPANGTVYKDKKGQNDLKITFTGFTTAAGTKVDIQVLTDANVIAETGWETIGQATSEATPTFFNDPKSPIFRWSVEAVPLTAATPARWRRGGLLRYRTVAVDAAGKRTLLPFFDERAGDCVDKLKLEPWKTVLATCRSAYSPELGAAPGGTARSAALVSQADDFEPNNGNFRNVPPYLNRKGRISPRDTDDYYDEVDAPRSLDEFERRFGFRNRNDVEAKYYNLADLGIGREMHCRSFEHRKGPSTACYVKNYGVDNNNQPDFNGNISRALDDLVEERDYFATVAMVKYGNAVAATPEGNDVQFFVYNALDVLVNEAQLDSTGQNESIPNNCLNCHGGKYDRRTRTIKDAVFLPFDPNGFLFSRRRQSTTYEAQADKFRELNSIVKKSGPPAPVVQFIDGTYSDKVDVAGTPANLDWVAKGWDTTIEARTVYREVIKPYCRTCHISQTDQFAFIRIEDFKTTAALSVKTLCGNKEMPNAEATIGLFFNSPARAHFVNALGLASACPPDRQR